MLRKFLGMLPGLLLVAGLAGCGGGSGGGLIGAQSSPTSGQSGPSYATAVVSLIADSPTLQTDGASKVTLTASVKDSATNTALSGVAVNFGANSGTLSAASVTTDSTGLAKVSFTSNDDKSNRDVTIAAKINGGGGATNQVSVMGTQITFGGPASAVLGTSSTITATLLDAAKSAIAGKQLKITSALDSTFSVTATTNSAGQAVITYPAKVAGSDTLTAQGLGAVGTFPIHISSASLNITSPAADSVVAVSSLGSINCVPVSAAFSGGTDTALVFSTTLGSLYSDAGCTSAPAQVLKLNLANGSATAYTKANVAGTTTVTVEAQAAGASVSRSFIYSSTTVAAITVQGQPSTVVVNSQSAVTAFVVDASGNPVAGKTIYFSTPNGGGTVTPPSAQTNASGVATTLFTASGNLSGVNGVTLEATDGSVTGSAQFTVAGQAVQVSLGTDNLVYLASGTPVLYQYKWLVSVKDSNGSPIKNQVVTISLGVPFYAKGYYVWSSLDKLWEQSVQAVCANEDTNGDGRFDNGETDTNGDGKITPATTYVVVPADGSASATTVSVTTDATGEAVVWIQGTPDEASWLKFNLTATAVVNGVNNVDSKVFWGGVPAVEVTNQTVPPKFGHSPYGLSSSCSNPN